MGYDTVIIDTAGRLHIDEALMQELENIQKEVSPNEILLTVDAMTGQDAVNVAETFNKRLSVTGVILTKLDGDTRGGACLSIKAVTGKPIKYIGVGEKLTDLEPFYPDRMASRILGMGDVLSLIEKAQEAVTEEQAKKMEKKLREASFTLEDYLDQFESLKKMGGISSVMGMMPGMGKLKIKESDFDERRIERVKAIILSMTKKEREKPEIINSSRKKRIAAGSGTNVQEVNQLLKQFDQTKLMMKQIRSGKNCPSCGKKMCACQVKSLDRRASFCYNRAVKNDICNRRSKKTMAVKMRLTRMGDKKSPVYRIVVVDSRKARDGEYIEKVGHYNPTSQPAQVVIDADKAKIGSPRACSRPKRSRRCSSARASSKSRPSSPRPAPRRERRSNRPRR